MKYYVLYNSRWHRVIRVGYDAFVFKFSQNVEHKLSDFEVKEFYPK